MIISILLAIFFPFLSIVEYTASRLRYGPDVEVMV